jgi:DNA-binding LacI/PurR family transcriptional regulator
VASRSSRVIKYQKVKETLAAEIEKGKYALGARLPSEKQLAEDFEVSIITVRQAVEALSREGYVEKIQGSGTYVRHLRPAVLRKVWALIVPNLKHSWYSMVAQGIEEVARAAGIQLVVAGTELEEEAGETIRRMVTMGAEAFAITPSVTVRPDPTPLLELTMAGVPFVFVSDFVDDVEAPRVVWDYQGGARIATEHLLSYGHRRIAFLSHPASHASEQMWNGYRAALTAAGLEPWPPRGLHAESFEETDMYRAARDLLALWPRPTAVFCTEDGMADYVAQAAADAGLSVPEELSIVSFLYQNSSLSDCGLTGVTCPKYDLGQEAGKILLRMIMGGSVTPEVVMPASLRLGRTTAPPQAGESMRPSSTQMTSG